MKKILAIILATLMMLSVVSCSKNDDLVENDNNAAVGGDEAVADGFTYEVNSKGDYDITGYKYTGTATVELTIPAEIEGRPVTGIANSAFKGDITLSKVTVPDSVVSIGDLAFAYCDSLTQIVLPDSVTTVGQGAFLGCTALADVKLSATLTDLGNFAFWGCSALTAITLPDTLTTIGDGAFWNCVALATISVPASVKSIGMAAFMYCDALTEAVVLNAEAVIGDGAFGACNDALVLKGAAESTLKTYAEAEKLTFAENK